MKAREPSRKYFNLVIESDTPEGQIWLGDDNGHFVQKAVGVLNTAWCSRPGERRHV